MTEPIGGYSQRAGAANGVDGELELNPPLDTPLDASYNPDPVTGVGRDALMTQGTTIDFAVVHLQRLANPLQPYHGTNNPYRTIDTHSVDVTAFNGVENENAADPTLIAGDYRFDAISEECQCIGCWHMGQPSRNLWTSEPVSANVAAGAMGNDNNQIFAHSLTTTLGYLNTTYGTPRADGTPNDATGHPFPWLQWNNRPFVSSLELMQVPYSKSSRLLFDYTFDRNGGVNPYNVPANGDVAHTEYNHLLNFFESGDNTANFQRIFDYLHSPSAYSGAYTYLNPLMFGSGFGTDELHPPFNRVSNFRDPGKININTIFDPAVYAGLMNSHLGTILYELD